MATTIPEFIKLFHQLKQPEYDSSLELAPTIANQYPGLAEEREEDLRTYVSLKFDFLLRAATATAHELEGIVSAHCTKMRHQKNFTSIAEELLRGFDVTTLDANQKPIKTRVPGWKDVVKAEVLAAKYRLCQLPQSEAKRWYHESEDNCHKWLNGVMAALSAKRETLIKGNWTEQFRSLGRDYELWLEKRRNELATEEELRAKARAKGDSDEAITQIEYTGVIEPEWSFNLEHKASTLFRQAINGHAVQVEATNRYLARCVAASADVLEQHSVAVDDVITDLSRETIRCFACFKHMRREMEPDDGFLGEASLSQLSVHLMQVAHASGFNKTDILTEFLHHLTRAFPCELADYLVSVSGNGKLIWEWSSVPTNQMHPTLQDRPPSELAEIVRGTESYLSGEGISGMILRLDAAEKASVWTHIGSNDVRHDPRADTRKATVYENTQYFQVLRASPHIENFWCFPIYKNRKLIGAFRVVNRLATADGKAILRQGGWTYVERVQLALVARWFSTFLDAIDAYFPYSDEFGTWMKRTTSLRKTLAYLDVAWPDEATLARLLSFLCRVSSLRSEERSLGCSVLIARESPDEAPPGERLDDCFQECVLFDLTGDTANYPYSHLRSYLDALDPLQRTLVYSPKCRFRKVIQLRGTHTGSTGREAIAEATKGNRALGFLIPRGVRRIEVYSSGERSAVLSISEMEGEWSFLVRRVVEDRLREAANALSSSAQVEIDARTLEVVGKTAIELASRGHGGILVVGDLQERPDMTDSPLSYNRNNAIGDLGEEMLAELAKLDGATCIGADGTLLRINSSVLGEPEGGLSPLLREKGNRHRAAYTLAQRCPRAIVLVVSQNRAMIIFKPGGKEAVSLPSADVEGKWMPIRPSGADALEPGADDQVESLSPMEEPCTQ
jgi:DNA integrity scanning protein DisA with diadenylate cyclase activity